MSSCFTHLPALWRRAVGPAVLRLLLGPERRPQPPNDSLTVAFESMWFQLPTEATTRTLGASVGMTYEDTARWFREAREQYLFSNHRRGTQGFLDSLLQAALVLVWVVSVIDRERARARSLLTH
jgi:hypothetical protein